MIRQLADFKVLTFDTYGTLIDWEAGIYDALKPLLVQTSLTREAALEGFSAAESAQQAATPTMIYSDLLSAIHRTLESFCS